MLFSPTMWSQICDHFELIVFPLPVLYCFAFYFKLNFSHQWWAKHLMLAMMPKCAVNPHDLSTSISNDMMGDLQTFVEQVRGPALGKLWWLHPWSAGLHNTYYLPLSLCSVQSSSGEMDQLQLTGMLHTLVHTRTLHQNFWWKLKIYPWIIFSFVL